MNKRWGTKKTLGCILITILTVVIPNGTHAQSEYHPTSSWGYGISGGSSYCVNAPAGPLTLSWGNASCPSSMNNYIPITITWYVNNTQSNTGGTAVSTINTNAMTTSTSYTPPTSVPGYYYYYVVISWNSGNCTPAGSITTPAAYSYPAVTVWAKPAPSLSFSSNPICSGAVATLTVNAGETGGGQQFTYSWAATSNPPPTTYTYATTYTIPVSPSTTDTYTLTVTDPNNCTASTVATLSVDISPTASLSASPSAMCTGSTATLTASESGGIQPFYYTWTATSNPPANYNNTLATSYTTPITPTVTTTYTLTVTDHNNCAGTAVTTVMVNPLPAVTANATHTMVCSGRSVVLTGGGASIYTWSNGVTNGIPYVVSSSQTFTVTGTDANNCSNTATVSVSALIPPTPNICMVTVDSLSMYNIIYWNKTSYTTADSFFIYRDTANNNYVLIGRVSKNSLSMYTDTARHIGAVNGNPNVGTYRYKLAIKDTCGNVGAMSPYHNTVYTIDLGNGTFTYNQYGIEGQPTPVPGLSQYVLKRDNYNTGNYVVAATIGASSTGINDPNYSTYQTTANWRVETNWTTVCTPTFRSGNNGTQTAVVKSRSNVRNNRTMGIKLADSKQVTVYPNPASDELMVLISGCSNCRVEIINSLGEPVKSIPVVGMESKVSLSDISSGIYFVKVLGNGQVYKLEKLVVQH